MKAVNIQWDTDGSEVLLELLPKEMEIPDSINKEEIGDWLSDEIGYCHFGFEIIE